MFAASGFSVVIAISVFAAAGKTVVDAISIFAAAGKTVVEPISMFAAAGASATVVVAISTFAACGLSDVCGIRLASSMFFAQSDFSKGTHLLRDWLKAWSPQLNSSAMAVLGLQMMKALWLDG